MTEAEWLASDDPARMLKHLRFLTYEEPTLGGITIQSRHPALISDRKLRLFACACTRAATSESDKIVSEDIETAELYADGLTSKDLLAASARPTRPGMRSNRLATRPLLRDEQGR